MKINVGLSVLILSYGCCLYAQEITDKAPLVILCSQLPIIHQTPNYSILSGKEQAEQVIALHPIIKSPRQDVGPEEKGIIQLIFSFFCRERKNLLNSNNKDDKRKSSISLLNDVQAEG